MSDSSNNLDRKNNARPSFNARVCSNFQQQSWPQWGVTRAIIYPKGWMLGNWKSDWETKLDLNLNEGRRPEWADWGGRGNWDLFRHSSSSFPPSYFTRNSWNTQHKLVVGCRISSDIIQGVCVSESDTCTRILCVIRLRWEYVAPSSWCIDSQHNIITPSIHSQISFLSTHHRWIRALS